ncbi:MAG: amidohydrolase family protein, partial [Actinobacteria bacterium]|nr:amidohydrolase family protein [Actinomycetota bacterium]
MIFDAHTHVGDFGPMFNVSLDRDGLAALIEEHGYEGCCVFHPDNEYVRTVIESIPEAYGLVWANPRMPGYLEEAERFLEHPKFLGLKLHPLIDGYHPNDPSVHPLMELLLERGGLPVLIHSGHPIFTLPWSIEELAVAFPGVKVIIGHMGHGNIV